MNKTLKITLISLGSLLGLILVVVSIACWLILTPARLTSIVRKQAPNFINCDFNIEKADLTLFKTFPKVGLKINNVVLVNPMEGSPSDTLAYIDECVVSVDVKKFLKENQIVIDDCLLNGGYVNLFVDYDGNDNLDIFPLSESDTLQESSDFTYVIDLAMLELDDVKVNYTDLSQGICADLNGLDIKARGKMKDNSVVANVDMLLSDLKCELTTDSLELALKLNGLKLEGDVDVLDDNIKANIETSSSSLLYKSEGQLAEFDAFYFKYDGDIRDYDVLKGNTEISLTNLSFVMENENLLDNADVRLIMPLNVILSDMNVDFGKSQFAFNDLFVNFFGKVSMPDEDVVVDLNLNTNTLIVEQLVELLPDSMREELLDGIDIKGELQLAAKVNGVYNETSMPVVNAEIEYNKGMLSMPEMLPYPITNLNTSIKADVDLNAKSDIYVKNFNANMSNSKFALSGTIKDVMDKMYCDINLKADADLDELQSFMPEGILAKGDVKLDVSAMLNNRQLVNKDFMKAKVNGSLLWSDMSLVYCDTISIDADQLNVNLTLPNTASENLTNSLAAVEISGANLDAKVSDMIVAGMKDYNIEAQVSNVLDENVPMSVYADYAFSRIDASMDDMEFFTNNPKGSVAMFMKGNGNDASYIAVYKGDSLSFAMGEDIHFITEKLSLDISADYDEDQDDLLLQWNPHAGVRLDKAVLAMSEIPIPISIPSIDFKYDSTGVEVQNSSIILGNSDFELKGRLTNVDEYLRKEALLKGKFDFKSHYTDVNQIMELFSGMGDTAVVVEEEVVDNMAVKSDEPFMVPLGIDVTLNTSIESAVAGQMNLNNIGGGLTVKDGVMVLQEMGFTSDAATMKVTAMYKSPRKNHLYLGLDLHLLEIDIAEMINLVPELDTLVPMLSSFAGDAEFHFAIETYMKSNYDLKMSTLRGAMAIRGKDLVVLDNETYKKIGRLLRFKDKEHNKIDNLSVEMTAFKNEIDVYPTLITIDKYQAVVGGRHNLDMTFDYRLGMSNPWLFRRLGIVIKGDMDNMKFRLRSKKNINLEEPKGNEEDVHVIEQTVRLKNIIYESLK